jgi:hypothetical protein
MRLFRISFSEHFDSVLRPIGALFGTLLVTSLTVRMAVRPLSDIPAIMVAGAVVVVVGFFVSVLGVLSSRERAQFLSMLRNSRLGKLVVE